MVTGEDLLFLSLHHVDGKKQKLSVWITVHALHWIWMHRDSGVMEMMLYLKKELFWHVALERWFCLIQTSLKIPMRPLLDSLFNLYAW